jgi:flagellar hook-basal body complex protein FliE
MNDLTITHLQPPPLSTVKPERDPTAETQQTPFSDYVKRSLEEVNRKMLEADKAIEDFTLGKKQDIHGTMIAMQKAEISFELVMQIRNKLVSAYDEIRRMSI